MHSGSARSRSASRCSACSTTCFDGAAARLARPRAAMLRGGFSTGALKAVGTLALAAFVVEQPNYATTDAMLAVAVIALATNLFNLLDLRPGRGVKAFVLLGAGLRDRRRARRSRCERSARSPAPLLVLGLYDLRERRCSATPARTCSARSPASGSCSASARRARRSRSRCSSRSRSSGNFGQSRATIERFPPLRALDSLGRTRSHA